MRVYLLKLAAGLAVSAGAIAAGSWVVLDRCDTRPPDPSAAGSEAIESVEFDGSSADDNGPKL
jgi:hypothetical protein